VRKGGSEKERERGAKEEERTGADKHARVERELRHGFAQGAGGRVQEPQHKRLLQKRALWRERERGRDSASERDRTREYDRVSVHACKGARETEIWTKVLAFGTTR
jgi:hypothetical protein